MKKGPGRWLAALSAVIVVLALLGVIHRYGVASNDAVTYDISGTYMGIIGGKQVYFVFEPDGYYCLYIPGEKSVVVDEGTYKSREHNIFTLESTIKQKHIVVCVEDGIYDFDINNNEVSFVDKITKEIYYVNLPDKVVKHTAE